MPSFNLECMLQHEVGRLRRWPLPSEPVVVHGDPARFAALRDIPSLATPGALLAAWDDAPGLSKAWSPGRGIKVEPAAGQVRALYDAGFCVLLQAIERFIPELQTICRRLDRELSMPVGTIAAEAFCALEASGTQPHFDDGVVLNCQLEGEKTWWLAENPAVRFPPWGMLLSSPVLDEHAHLLSSAMPKVMPEATTRTEVARPGTVVFLPAGALHATRVESASFAVCFTMIPPTLAGLVTSEVSRCLVAQEALRAPLLRSEPGAGEVALAAAELRRIADELERGAVRPWSLERRPVRLRAGLSIGATGTIGDIAITTPSKTRVLSVGVEIAAILTWAAGRAAPFDFDDLAEALAHVALDHLRRGVGALVKRGLLEIAV